MPFLSHPSVLMLFFLLFTQPLFAQSNRIDSLLKWISKHPKVDSQYILTLHRISYRYSENNIQKAFTYYEMVSSLSDSLNFTYGKSLAQINLGLVLASAGNYEASNNAYFKAIEFAEKCNALRLKAVSLNNIGDNFSILEDFTKCRQYTLKAILINHQLKAWRGVAVNYELLHQCDLKEKLYGGARHNLDMGMPYARKANESYILSQYYLGYGKLYAINNHMDSANYYFSRAMMEANTQDELRNKYQVYRAKAEYLKLLSPAKKISLLDSAYSIAKQTRYHEGIIETSEELSNVYDQLNKKDSSLFYYRIFRSAYDSLFTENNRWNLVIKEADWMIKRKEIENQHLKELSLIQKKDLIFKNTLLLTIIVLLLLIITSSAIIYNHIQSHKKNVEASLKQKITNIQMQSLRAQMNPHFIFNSLNSIENFIMKNEKVAASNYLNKFSELIRIILDSSRTELVPFTKNMEGIRLYVELEQLRFNHKFSFNIKADDELLNGDYKVPSLLTQPYIENAIVHGISQSEKDYLELNLEAKLEGDYIIYTIRDNGIGREKSRRFNSQNKPNHNSMGLQLIEERINIFNLQQNGEGGVVITDLYDENHEPCGTRIELKIKAI